MSAGWQQFFDGFPVRPVKIEPIESDDGFKALRLTYWAVDPGTRGVRYFVLTVDQDALLKDPRGLGCHVHEKAVAYAEENGWRPVNREDVL